MNDRTPSAGEARATRAHRSLWLLEPLDADRLRGTLSQCGDLAARLGLGRTATHAEVRSLRESGKAALDRARERPELVSQLTPLEVTGLEAIVVAVGRPALLIRNDHFDAPSSPWEMLETHRAEIGQLIISVGLIELTGHPSKYAGTGSPPGARREIRSRRWHADHARGGDRPRARWQAARAGGDDLDRSAALPNMPTMAEACLPGISGKSWRGDLAPTGTPAAIVVKLNRDIQAVIDQLDMRAELEDMGFEVVGGMPSDLARTLTAERLRDGHAIQTAGITLCWL